MQQPDVIFIETNNDELDGISYRNGQILYTRDTNRLYIDFGVGGKRNQIGDCVILQTDSERKKLAVPKNLIYYVKETSDIWIYDEGWHKANGTTVSVEKEIENINKILEQKVEKKNGYSLVSDEDIEKIKNIISNNDDEGKVSVEEQIKVLNEYVETNNKNIESINNTLGEYKTIIDYVNDNLPDIIKKSEEHSFNISQILQNEYDIINKVNVINTTLTEHGNNINENTNNITNNTNDIKKLQEYDITLTNNINILNENLGELKEILQLIIDGSL